MRSRKNAVALIGALVLVSSMLAGCAGPAPDLPTDTTGTTSLHHVAASDFTPADVALSCAEIKAQHDEQNARIDRANANVIANRSGNQAATLAGAIVPLAYIGTEGNYSDKDAIKDATARRDVLDKLAVLKHC
jgi:hypothetical protein